MARLIVVVYRLQNEEADAGLLLIALKQSIKTRKSVLIPQKPHHIKCEVSLVQTQGKHKFVYG
jgi:hypothetical protein